MRIPTRAPCGINTSGIKEQASILIREADIDRDREEIINFLRDNLTTAADRNFYEWRYQNNPSGRARAWIAYENNAPIGIAGAFPRLMRIRGRETICWNLGDFAVRSDYRTLGPALLLQRACIAPVMGGEIPFCYDHPNRRMLAIYKRMGVVQTGEVYRFAKPLRVDDKVNKKLGGGVASRLAKGVGNAILAIRDVSLSRGDYTFSAHEGKFGDEFSSLDSHIEGIVSGRRTTEYLNWRYRDNPYRKYEAFALRVGGRAVAYTVIAINNNTEAIAAELIGEDDKLSALLGETAGVLRRRGVAALSVMALGAGRLAAFLSGNGFYRRESSPFVVCAGQGGEFRELVLDERNWHLTHGDQDL